MSLQNIIHVEDGKVFGHEFYNGEEDISIDLLTKLWENSSPTSAMANNTEINLSSNDYDLLLVIVKAVDTATTNTVTTIAKKGVDIQLSYPASTSNISQRFLRYQTDIKYKTSDATDTSKAIPLAIYGIKTSQTVHINAIASDVSTSADKCMLSDGETSVEDVLEYSTTEHIVGKWIDGKPLYEKTIDCGALPNATSKTISSGLSNVTIRDMRGMASRSSDGFSIPLPYPTAWATNQLDMSFDGNQNIYFITLYDWSAYYAYVTLRYTKTTD